MIFSSWSKTFRLVTHFFLLGYFLQNSHYLLPHFLPLFACMLRRAAIQCGEVVHLLRGFFHSLAIGFCSTPVSILFVFFCPQRHWLTFHSLGFHTGRYHNSLHHQWLWSKTSWVLGLKRMTPIDIGSWIFMYIYNTVRIWFSLPIWVTLKFHTLLLRRISLLHVGIHHVRVYSKDCVCTPAKINGCCNWEVWQ